MNVIVGDEGLELFVAEVRAKLAVGTAVVYEQLVIFPKGADVSYEGDFGIRRIPAGPDDMEDADKLEHAANERERTRHLNPTSTLRHTPVPQRIIDDLNTAIDDLGVAPVRRGRRRP